VQLDWFVWWWLIDVLFTQEFPEHFCKCLNNVNDPWSLVHCTTTKQISYRPVSLIVLQSMHIEYSIFFHNLQFCLFPDLQLTAPLWQWHKFLWHRQNGRWWESLAGGRCQNVGCFCSWFGNLTQSNQPWAALLWKSCQILMKMACLHWKVMPTINEKKRTMIVLKKW